MPESVSDGTQLLPQLVSGDQGELGVDRPCEEYCLDLG